MTHNAYSSPLIDPSLPTVRYGGEQAVNTVGYDVGDTLSTDTTLSGASLNAGMANVSASPQTDPTVAIKEICALLTQRTLTSQHRESLQKTLERLLKYEGDVVPTELAAYAQSLFRDVSRLTHPGVEPSMAYSGVNTATLIAGTESFINEATLAIRQWGKQIGVKISQLWDGYFRSVKDIEDQLSDVDKQLQRLRQGVVVSPLVTIPAINVKLTSVNGKPVLENKQVASIIKDEIGFLLTLIKVWRTECIAYKNRVIRYFGNEGELPLKLLNRPHPPLWSKLSFVDDDDMQYKNYVPAKTLIGGGNISFHESTHNATTVTEKAGRLVDTRYTVILAKETHFTRYTDVRQEPWPLKTIDRIYDAALQTVEVMRSLAKDESALDVKEKEIQEVITIVKQLPGPTLTDAFTDIITAYQLDVSRTQQNLFRYLYDFVTILIDTLNIHIQAYRSA